MWRFVDPALIDVLEERIASIFKVEKFSSGEPASAGGCRLTPVRDNQHIRTGREGVYATWEINREERGGVCGEGQQQVAEGCL
jgi:hypothetical protein